MCWQADGKVRRPVVCHSSYSTFYVTPGLFLWTATFWVLWVPIGLLWARRFVSEELKPAFPSLSPRRQRFFGKVVQTSC